MNADAELTGISYAFALSPVPLELYDRIRCYPDQHQLVESASRASDRGRNRDRDTDADTDRRICAAAAAVSDSAGRAGRLDQFVPQNENEETLEAAERRRMRRMRKDKRRRQREDRDRDKEERRQSKQQRKERKRARRSECPAEATRNGCDERGTFARAKEDRASDSDRDRDRPRRRDSGGDSDSGTDRDRDSDRSTRGGSLASLSVGTPAGFGAAAQNDCIVLGGVPQAPGVLDVEELRRRRLIHLGLLTKSAIQSDELIGVSLGERNEESGAVSAQALEQEAQLRAACIKSMWQRASTN